jgi:hypothetical protein
MKKFASMFAVAALALVGCGGDDLCDDLSSTDKDFYEKTKACSALNDGSPYEEPTESDFDQCEEAVKSCSDSEKDKIKDFNECVSDLPTCTAATEDDFIAAFAGCALTHLSGVSEKCGGSITEESVRNALRLTHSR